MLLNGITLFVPRFIVFVRVHYHIILIYTHMVYQFSLLYIWLEPPLPATIKYIIYYPIFDQFYETKMCYRLVSNWYRFQNMYTIYHIIITTGILLMKSSHFNLINFVAKNLFFNLKVYFNTLNIASTVYITFYYALFLVYLTYYDFLLK